MTLTIKSGKLSGEGVTQHKTKKVSSGRVNKKRFVVIHYTGGSSFDNDVATLSTSTKEVSCHIVIGRDGQVAMIGSFDDVQWHAGRSKWKGIDGLNGYSIGIELTNPGYLDILGGKKYKTYYGQVFDDSDGRYNIVEAAHPAIGRRTGWLPYSKEQLLKLMEICELLKKTYNIEEFVGHEQISPGRKQDPAIGIILDRRILDKLNSAGRNSDDFYEGKDNDVYLNGDTKEVQPEGENYRVTTSGSTLRLRDNASLHGKVIGGYENKEVVTVLEIKNGWAKVKASKTDPEGYLSAQYLKKTELSY